MTFGRSPTTINIIILWVIFCCLSGCAPVSPPTVRIEPPPVTLPAPEAEAPAGLPVVEDYRFGRIDGIVRQEVAAGHIPGAVILVGHQGKIVYRKAFGLRAVEPRPQGLTPNTVFDIASLTKVVATTTAIMQLADQGRLRLDEPAAKYWPEFGQNGKSRITLRQLLTHTSGLRAEVNSKVSWSGYYGALTAIAMDKPVNPPGTQFRYSDANFIVLGEMVRRVSGRTLDAYAAQEIFKPLGMRHTCFKPPPAWQTRIAPCDRQGGELRCGQVQDPTAFRMGGVAGHAGVFSTADDLAVFAQMLLDGGGSRGPRLLSPQAVAAMTKPYGLPGNATRRGLGWDIRSPYSKDFNAAFPAGSFGHTGYTGTSMWLDPRSKTFLIILTSRLHPDGKGQVKALRARTAAAVAAALNWGKGPGALAKQWSVASARWSDPKTEDRRPKTGNSEYPSPPLNQPLPLLMGGHGQADVPDRVRSGIEVLAASGFSSIKGKTIGVITNHTGRDAGGRSTVAILRQAPGVQVRAIFSPEHGLSGNLDEKVASGKDPATGLPVYSLYGEVKRPTPQMLKGLDALVYDIQDVGVRFYTYITTMAYCMEAAAAAGLDFYVLDRPDPVTASMVQGPVLAPDLKSFIGYFPLPVRYGMTPGELAQLFNRENEMGVRLQVVRMEGYRREAFYDETGLPWINPSPNLRSLAQAILYTGVGLVEAANVSVGRGTATPFEVVGAPWISGERLARYLRGRKIAGVEFEPVSCTPAANRFRGQKCEGVRLRLVDRAALDGPALGIELAAALYRLYPGKFQIDRTLSMIGSQEVLQAVKEGDDPRDICRRWQPALDAFRRVRARYLLY